MKFLRLVFIFGVTFFSFFNGDFVSANGNVGQEQKEEATSKAKVQSTINKYILNVYKNQGNKILEELDNNLEKVATTKEAKAEAYASIQKTLTLKKESVEKDENIGKNAKTILIKYLNYMISEIQNRKNNL